MNCIKQLFAKTPCLPSYCCLQNKKRFLQSYEINTKGELDNFIKTIGSNKDYVFRGINEAKHMLYSSAQVRTNASLDQGTYENIISNAIKQVRGSSIIMDYLNKYSNDKTDFQILALMQHFGCGTPIIDYTTDIYSALFFATDRKDKKIVDENEKGIDAYMSVHFFNVNDPNHCSIQNVNYLAQQEVNDIDNQLSSDKTLNYGGISDQAMYSFREMPFKEMCELKDGGLFSVLGHSNGVIQFKIAKETIEYNVENERLDAQKGLFLFNGLSQKAYEEAAFDWYPGIKNHCANIHKSLEKDIKDYLQKEGITRDVIYPNTDESKVIIRELRRLKIDKRLKP